MLPHVLHTPRETQSACINCCYPINECRASMLSYRFFVIDKFLSNALQMYNIWQNSIATSQADRFSIRPRVSISQSVPYGAAAAFAAWFIITRISWLADSALLLFSTLSTLWKQPPLHLPPPLPMPLPYGVMRMMLELQGIMGLNFMIASLISRTNCTPIMCWPC